ncbi:MAG TPA: cyclodeaminase/cyclohydrolase family protein [Candidatus Thalassarchaeaceae archaeon]|jgi:formiminotetrahydrofolate cyclodeaminase|nr:cyclodeaminase/cyclohydrolase family protein [Candidatus Thalassarchaeaceae archaeon]|tara:strand:- start:126818 stop:127438 length:621 start_codon:yes stop_codon:yes gene_type:complete
MNDGYSRVLDSIASSEPTPGGGSVAALSLAHAHSLAIMVSRLTLGKEKWVDGHEISKLVISNSEIGVEHSIKLAEIDAEAFDCVMDAYRLPRGDEKTNEARKLAIRTATIGAAEAPLATAEAAQSLLAQVEALSENCNANALTDLASSAELAFTAANIAAMNVRINLEYLVGDDVQSLTSSIDDILDDSRNMVVRIRLRVNERLGW